MNGNTIRLRAVEPGDADFMYRAETDPDAWKYSDYTAPLSRELLLQYALTYDADPLRAGQIRLIIEDNGIPVGIADLFEISARHLHADTGVYILPQHRDRGIAVNALSLLEEYSRERLGLHQLTATVAVSNETAAHTYRKAGFNETGRRPDWLRQPQSYEDVILFSKII